MHDEQREKIIAVLVCEEKEKELLPPLLTERPLSEYSTSQLKAELRRRKKERSNRK